MTPSLLIPMLWSVLLAAAPEKIHYSATTGGFIGQKADGTWVCILGAFGKPGPCPKSMIEKAAGGSKSASRPDTQAVAPPDTTIAGEEARPPLPAKVDSAPSQPKQPSLLVLGMETIALPKTWGDLADDLFASKLRRMARLTFQRDSATRCGDSSCALAAGKRHAADRVAFARLERSPDGYLLSARILETSTGSILSSTRRSTEGAFDRSLLVVVEDAVAELSGQPIDPAPARAGAAAPSHPKERRPLPPPDFEDTANVDAKSRKTAWPWVFATALAAGGGAAVFLLEPMEPQAAPPPKSNNDMIIRWAP
ncbi:MAG TPA: hypothetical protein PKO15_04610 [Fibrobacteria bacterium]|nr:hypothetical protein [Fibrobacteria bacterium]